MIRKCNIDDACAIASLETKCFRSPLSLEFITNDIKNNPFNNYLVYEIDGSIIGYIGLWVTDNIEILNFCVDIDYRRQKIGSKLLLEATKIADEKQIDICLEVRRSNEKAINLYLKNNFKQALVRKAYYENKEDALLMIRKCNI